MTISTTIVKNSYAGNGATTVFNYNFKILSSSDLKVIIRSTNGTETTKTLNTHYTITGVGSAVGGSVTFTAGNIPVSGQTIVLIRDTAQTQSIDYVANDPFPAETHEEGLDKGIILTQELQEEIDRCLKLSKTNTMNSTEFYIGPADRAGKILGFDGNGELVVSQELGTYKGNWSTATTYSARDIVKDTVNGNIYFCNTGHSSVGVAPISTNADAGKWNLLVDVSQATTAATASATSAAAALASQNAASSSASAASSSASAASSSASSASSSASAASSSAANAASSFDDFDDRYLGSKSSAPSLDNDGNALINGALYWNSVSAQMFVRDSGAWIAIKPTTVEQGNITTVAGISGNITTVAGILANVTSVAGNSSNINSVATNIANVNSVATNIANINAVNSNSANINAVNSNSTNINAVAGISGNVTTVANNIAKVNEVYTEILKVVEVANDLQEATSEIEVVANNIANVNSVGNNIANVNAVNSNSANINAVVSNAANINSVASNSTNINLVSGSIANVNIAGANINSVNDFVARYRVSGTQPTTSLDIGDLWFDSTLQKLLIYTSAGWQTASDYVSALINVYRYTATSGQTVFSGVAANGNTLSFTAQANCFVFLNGIRIVLGQDYTLTGGNTVTLTEPANAGDLLYIEVIAKISITEEAILQGYVTTAGNSATTATTQAGISTAQATIATTQAGISTAQATTSTTQAGIATTQAGIATTQATNSAASASASATSASNSASSASAAAASASAAAAAAGGGSVSISNADTTSGKLNTKIVVSGSLTKTILNSGAAETLQLGVDVIFNETYFTATAGQTTFNTAYTPNYIQCFVNGIKLIKTQDFTATNGTSVILNDACVAGDVVEFVKFK